MYAHQLAEYRRDQRTQKRERLIRLWRLAHVPLRNLLSRLVTPNSAVSVLAVLAVPVIAGTMS